MSRVSFLFWLDAVLLAAVTILQTPRSTGLALHEWGSIAFAAIVVLHLLVNWSWITRTLRRVRVARSGRERTNLLLNTTLLVVVVLALFSGLMISEVLLPLVGLERSTLEAWRSLHRFFSATALVVVGLHIALNWDWIVGVVRTRQFMRSVATSGRASVSLSRLNVRVLIRALRRASVITCVAVATSVACYTIVRLSTDRESRAGVQVQLGRLERAQGWAGSNGFTFQSFTVRPEAHAEAQTIFMREVAIALLSIILGAVAGRTVLRLRL